MRNYCHTNIIKVGIYGFMSGISLLLSGNTINFWLANFGIDPKIIGFFSLIALPYAFKYFIAIFINHFHIKRPQYKIWLITSQLMLSLSLVTMSFLDLKDNLWKVAIVGFAIAFFAVIQDIILSTNRIKILEKHQQVEGTALHSIGYRLGMLFSGAGVIFSSVFISWSSIFLILASVYLLMIVFICFAYKESDEIEQEDLLKEKGKIWNNIFIRPFKSFLPFKKLIWFLLFVLIYRMADNMLIVMVNPFFLKTGYTATEIASIYKFFGTIMVIIGGFISSYIINKLGMKRSLLSFSIAHMLGSFLYIILSVTGKNIPLLYAITGYEALTGGMMMTVYIAYISSICNGKYTASQYALFSSAMGLSRVIFPIASGIIVDCWGLTSFFVSISVISLCTVFFTAYVLKGNRIEAA
jgi:PAT family beta-lactamase induction signal transducer AmpG